MKESDRPGSRFSIVRFTRRNLFQALTNPFFKADEVALHGCSCYLYGYLSELGAHSIVIEHDYTDADYLDDFAAYYVRCFTSYNRKCKRLHFFRSKRSLLSDRRFMELLTGDLPRREESSLRKNYLGFIVARPLPQTIIGRTVLQTFDSERGRRNYPCVRDYQANLFGLDLTVKSLAFQEQDTVLAACATVSVWCCLHKTGHLFGTPIPTPAEITRVANQVVSYGRPIPSHGLNVVQICNAIRQTGLEAEVVTVRPDTPLLSLIYAHVKMGLPVILGVELEGRGGHAITVAGYSYREGKGVGHEVAPGEVCAPMIGMDIDKLYAHDDQIGPFSRVLVGPSATVGKTIFPVLLKGSWTDPATHKALNMYPTVVIIPVYRKIRVTFSDIHRWLYMLTQVLSVVHGSRTPLKWDVYLTTSNEYKKQMRATRVATSRVLGENLLKAHPRFIWRAALRMNGEEVLELLGDATDMPRAFPFYSATWFVSSFKTLIRLIVNLPGNQEPLKKLLSTRFLEFLKGQYNR
jgi:hypothetical protein